VDGREHSTADGVRIAHLVDAGAWLAAARKYYCAVIEAATASTPLAVESGGDDT
jgi:hypothetical protein